MSKVLYQIRKDPRVEIVDDERSIGGNVIVTLRYGWRFQSEGEHVFGEDTATAALRSMRRVQACRCAECRPRNVIFVGRVFGPSITNNWVGE